MKLSLLNPNCQQGGSKLKFLDVSALLILLFRVIKAEIINQGRCPLNHFTCIKERDNADISQVMNQPWPIGHTVHHFCDHSGGQHEYRMLNFPEDFVVYPSDYTTCRANGAWSGMPPVCIDKTALRNTRFFDQTVARCRYCSNCHCPETEQWSTIGKYQPKPADQRLSSNFVIQRVMCDFHRHVHLSIITFNVANNSSEMSLTVKVEPRDVIQRYSEKAAGLQYIHCSQMRNHNKKLRNGSRESLCNLGAYTRRLYFEATVPSRHQDAGTCTYNHTWRVAPNFFAIPHLNDCSNPAGKSSIPESYGDSMKNRKKKQLASAAKRK